MRSNQRGKGRNRSRARAGDKRPPGRSGAKAGTYVAKGDSGSSFKKGDPVMFVRGWKYDQRHGMRTFFASEYKKTREVKSKTGRQWQTWVCTVTHSDGSKRVFPALYDVQARKVIINDLSYIMNPGGGPGGYTGPYYYRKS